MSTSVRRFELAAARCLARVSLQPRGRAIAAGPLSSRETHRPFERKSYERQVELLRATVSACGSSMRCALRAENRRIKGKAALKLRAGLPGRHRPPRPCGGARLACRHDPLPTTHRSEDCEAVGTSPRRIAAHAAKISSVVAERRDCRDIKRRGRPSREYMPLPRMLRIFRIPRRTAPWPPLLDAHERSAITIRALPETKSRCSE